MFDSFKNFVDLFFYLRHTKRKIFNNLYIPILLILIGSISVISISYMLSTPETVYHFNRYSIFMILEVAGIFLLFKNLGNLNLNIKFFSNPNGIFKKAVFSLAKYSYGFYLLHSLILTVLIMFLKYYTNLTFKPLFLVSFVSIITIFNSFN